MPETSLAAMGVVVQWSSELLLFLFFFRLGRPGARRDSVQTWMAAWAAQVVSITGSLVTSVGILFGEPTPGTAAVRWLDLLYIPGTLLFAALVGVGALQGAGRRVPATVSRGVVLTTGVLGAMIAFVNDPMVTGSAFVVATVAVFFGLAVAVAIAERRERPRRFPLLAAAMFLTGAMTLVYQFGAYFGQLVWPIDDFVATAGWSAGYAGALTSLILAGALITLIMDDAFRGTVATCDSGVREPIAPEIVSFDTNERTVEETLEEIAPEPAALEPEVAVAAPSPVARHPATGARLRHTRTATLPRPPVNSNGRLAEVLLVDDEAAVRSTLARIFQRGGWSVRDLSTGEEALAWLLDVPADAAPAVILCEYTMPGMGGRDVHAHLMRERPELVSRMVFVTGDTSRESARAFIATTTCPLVEKPFMVREIARAVEQVLAVPPRHAG
jgi:CheY-like chemotaxis protein